MAKVMISIPDGLLARLDQLAAIRGETRSGLLQSVVSAELERSEGRRADAVTSLRALVRPAGGSATELIRQSRDSR